MTEQAEQECVCGMPDLQEPRLLHSGLWAELRSEAWLVWRWQQQQQQRLALEEGPWRRQQLPQRAW